MLMVVPPPRAFAPALLVLLLGGCEYLPFYGTAAVEAERDRLVAQGYRQVAENTADGATFVLEYSGDPAGQIACRPPGHNRFIPLRGTVAAADGTTVEYRTDIRISLTRRTELFARSVARDGIFALAALSRAAPGANPTQIELIDFPEGGEASFRSGMACRAK